MTILLQNHIIYISSSQIKIIFNFWLFDSAPNHKMRQKLVTPLWSCDELQNLYPLNTSTGVYTDAIRHRQ